MAKTRTWDRDRLVAGTVAVAIHLLLAWGVSRLLMGSIPPRGFQPTLQLFWVTATSVPATSPADKPRSPQSASARPPPAPRPPFGSLAETATPIGQRPLSIATSPSAISSAAYIDQARRWVGKQSTIEFAASDPLARRPIDLPGRAGRLRLRKPIGPAEVVAKIATVLGGVGYNPDPCPELRKDVNDLALAGDSPALQDALYYEKRACP